MKELTTLIILFFFVAGTCRGQDQGTLSSDEREEIADYMETAWDELESSIEDLSHDQWSYKPADSVWSIAEIAEHLEKTEHELFNLVSQHMVQSEAQPEKATEVGNKTESVMKAITSREHKVKTRPNLEPEGKYDSPEEFLQEFQQLRTRTLEFSQNTDHQLRHHFVPFGPLGELDGYQILMFMTGHLERHRQQIEELKADPNYPPA